MIRGVSKQVIVVEGRNNDFYETAIFLLKAGDCNASIAEKELLRQAKESILEIGPVCHHKGKRRDILWAFCGFSLAVSIWLLTNLL